jgi:hypothetical protein
VRPRALETTLIRSTALLVLSTLALAACADVPKPKGSAVRSSDPACIAEVSPLEIAVAPVVNAAGRDVPQQDLRVAFHRALVERRYSPLALEYVDRKVVDAAYTPGAAEESATMTITIEKWDASLWATHGAVTAKMSVQIVDPKGGAVLWSGTTDRRFDFPDVRENLSTERARIQYACNQIASEILTRLPSRTARP